MTAKVAAQCGTQTVGAIAAPVPLQLASKPDHGDGPGTRLNHALHGRLVRRCADAAAIGVAAANAAEANVERIVSLSAAHFDSAKKVPVKSYARHVLAEAERVNAAEAALVAGDLKAFGKTMNESHDSLRQDYRCSTPALDRVAAAMRKAGAFGARLTGAGFGGYAVAACPTEAVARVIEAALTATGGPAFEVRASDGVRLL